MMLLALETATTRQSVAIMNGQHMLGYAECESGQSLTAQLIPTIDQVLTSASLQMSDLEGLAISMGPGSFTGLRVGLSTATAFRLALNLPLAGVSTLEGLVWNQPPGDLPIISTIRIRPGMMYWGLYRWENQRVVCLKEAQMGECVKILKAVSEPTVLLGNGCESDHDFSQYPCLEVPDDGVWPSAKGIALAGQIMLRNGEVLPQGCTPHYIQPSYAERVPSDMLHPTR